MPDPGFGFLVRLSVDDFDPTPVDQASRALRDYSLTVDSTANSVEHASTSLSSFGHDLISPTIAAIEIFTEFQQTMFLVQKVTGDTDSKMRDLSSSLIDLSRETTLTANSLGNVAAIAGQFGIRGTQGLEQFTATVARMALVTDLTAESAAKSFSRLSSAYDLSILQVEKLGSAINELSNRTVASAQDLVSIATRLSPLASTIGLTAQQALGLAATLKEVGFTSEEAGTSLTTVLQRMGSMLPKFAHVAGVAGTEFKRLFIEDPMTALMTLFDGLHKLAQESTPRALEAVKSLGLTGTRSSKVLLALANNVEDLKRNMDVSNTAFERGTSLQDEFNIQTRSLAAQIELLVNRVQAIGLKIGSVLVPPLNLLVQVLSVAVNLIASIPAPILALVAVTIAAAGAVLLFASALLSVNALHARLSISIYALGDAYRSTLIGIALTTQALWLENAAMLYQLPLAAAMIVGRIRNAIVATYEAVAKKLTSDATMFEIAATTEWLTLKAIEIKDRIISAAVTVRDAVARQFSAAMYLYETGQLKFYIVSRIAELRVRLQGIAAMAVEYFQRVRAAAVMGYESAVTQASNLAKTENVYLTYEQAGAALAAAEAQGVANVALKSFIATAGGIALVATLLVGVVYGYYKLFDAISRGSKAAQLLGIAIAFALTPVMPILSALIYFSVAYANNLLGIRTALFFLARALGFVFGSIYAAIRDAFAPLMEALSDAARGVSELFKSIAWGGTVAEETFGAFKKYVSEVFAPFRDSLKILVDDVKELFYALGLIGDSSLKDSISSFAVFTINVFLKPLEYGLKLMSLFLQAFTYVARIVVSVMTPVAEFVMSIFEDLRQFFQFFYYAVDALMPPLIILKGILYAFLAGLLGLLSPVIVAFGVLSVAVLVIVTPIIAFFGALVVGAKVVSKALALIVKPFEWIYEAMKEVKDFAFQSSLLHLGEGAQEAAAMISASLPGAFQEVQDAASRIKPIVQSAAFTQPAAAAVAVRNAAMNASSVANAASAKASQQGGSRGSGQGGKSVELVIPIALTVDGRTIAQIVQRVFIEDELLGYGPLRFSPSGG